MDGAWVILQRRYGEEVRCPSAALLAEAIGELYRENLPGMTEGDYEEHGAGSLRYGFDDGPMIVVGVSRHGLVTLEEWADQDYKQELSPPRVMRALPEEQALRLWLWLARGEIGSVRSQAWEARA
jgi:hypothetical protein